MKRIVILGSTGSIGTQALDILSQYPEFKFIALAANENIDLLEKQALKFRPAKVAVTNAEKAVILRDRLPKEIEVLSGKQALVELASLQEVDIVLVSVVGISGLEATLVALESGKDIALANKETLVAGGSLVMETARQSGSKILPVDSEHSAIFQCLQGSKGNKEVQKILLTASGGPFRGFKREQLEGVTTRDALNHPRWHMGKKVTVDSATLMNKGLEVIEAKWLFELNIEQIEVLIHPQSVIHSMVQYIDGSIIAQLGPIDMRLPILYAFTWPNRLAADLPRVNFTSQESLSFEEPDMDSFPSLQLAYEALRINGTMPAVLNAANELAVERFLKSSISFTDIPRIVEKAMVHHQAVSRPALEDILLADKETRERLERDDKL
ncbi:MAG TPA: 1-deoxy-D-xylulose-5-phosphate reductoisomerase [Clostridiales bacterium]|nr:1-deoxy-D-xylulose-5-phosphate reductoisomerase [Clostridia bacterium]MDD4680653.1 1-deoxy-D-xylulose-5-phosphate reductoisomerase [Clostridia bacterium]HCS75110.1 1-deoxy-D-xylulose-5-phosphate reductoisomerase [Clostridiales bacterium]